MHIFTKQMKKFQVSMLKKRQTYVVSEKKLHDSLDQIITLCMAINKYRYIQLLFGR